MEIDMAEELRPFYNVGPGDIIQDSLDALCWQQEDLADLTGLSLQTINKLIKNKQSITVETANLLGKAFNTSAELWLNLDTAHQLRRHQEGDKEKLTEKKARLRKYMPLAEMRKKNWFVYDNDFEGLTLECRRLFNNDDIVEEVYDSAEMYCARRGKLEDPYTAWYSQTWYLIAREHAQSIELPPFNRKRAEKIAQNLSYYTTQDEGISLFLKELKTAGVGFFVLSHLQKTFLDGASFYAGKNPFIVYTGRFNRIDNFWFTIAHELAHVLKHLKANGIPILDNLDNASNSAMEIEADSLAAQYLHMDEILTEGKKIEKYLTPQRLKTLSAAVGVSIPVVVGILQHAKILEWRQFTRYRETVLDKIPIEYIKG